MGHLYNCQFISCLTVVFVVSLLPRHIHAISETRVATSAPVQPVKEGAILSIHCQISNLAADHYVTISRLKDGTTSPQILTWGETVLGSGDIGDNIFLAIRQLNDGSIIYFLSIISVTTSDQGKYICKVMPSTQDSVVAMDATHIKIHYFPRDPNPLCSPKTSGLTVYAGTQITLNCTSDTAFPGVDLTWSRGADRVPESNAKTFSHNGISYTELRFRASLNDNEAVFLCQISSVAFPSKVKTCHVGPINVLPNPNHISSNANEPDEVVLPTIKTPPVFYPTKSPIPDDKYTDPNIAVADCREVCSTFSSPKFFWIVATVIACACAFIFFLMGALLLWKYRQAQTQQQHTYYSTNPKQYPVQTREYIYTELDSKRTFQNTENIGSCVYMGLERRANDDNQNDLTRIKSVKE